MEVQQKSISKSELIEKLNNILTGVRFILTDLNKSSVEVKDVADNSISETKDLLSNKHNSELFTDLIQDKYNDIFDNFYSSYGFDKPPEVKKEITRLDRFRKSLEYIIDYLSIENLNDNSELVLPIESVIEKSDFILTKLNELFNDKFYSVSIIFDLNNIIYRNGEPREIVEDLSRRGYLTLKEQYRDKDNNAKISVKGAAYIERKNKSKNTKKRKQNIDSKINQISDMLTKLGYGQEIIFNEMEEIKDLHSKLNKKNWTELVKGKLIDLGLSQTIKKEVISEIYEMLIEDKLILIK